MKRAIVVLVLLYHSFAFSAERVQVLSTTGMIADIVRNLMPDNIIIYQMMRSGIDPHTYKPLARDIQRLQQAKIILYNGLYLEANLHKIFSRLPNAVAICEKIDKKLLLAGDYETSDPHLWMSVTLWISCVQTATKALQDFFPELSELIFKNSQKYQTELRQLEIWIQKKIATLPVSERILVTAHDAFRYFGKAYEFDVHAIQGISTVSEAGIEDIRSLADFVVKNKVPAIFLEASVAEHNILALRAAIISRGWQVQVAPKLYSDSMGAKGSGYDNYQAMMKYNTTTIVEALQKK